LYIQSRIILICYILAFFIFCSFSLATLWLTYFVGSGKCLLLYFLINLRCVYFFFNIAFPLEMLKSPLEKAKKIELEKNIFLKLGKSINAYEYKYVSIIYANESKGHVCYTTIEETLAHCFLRNNTWDREKIVSLIDKCGKTDINKMDFKKDNPPYFFLLLLMVVSIIYRFLVKAPI
jgi:hypothetical protein